MSHARHMYVKVELRKFMTLRKNLKQLHVFGN